MGLNLYSGSLTRYYAKDWEPVHINPFGRDPSKKSALDPSTYGQVFDSMDSEAICAKTIQWRDRIIDIASTTLDNEIYPWMEGADTGYYTNNLTWESYFGVMMCAISGVYRRPLPQWIDPNQPIHHDELFKKAYGDRTNPVSYLLRTDWWLPSKDFFVFNTQSPDGTRKTVASTTALAGWLTQLNKSYFQATDDVLQRWRLSEGPQRLARMKEEGISDEPIKRISFASSARHGFAVISRALGYSIKYQMPLILHY